MGAPQCFLSNEMGMVRERYGNGTVMVRESLTNH